MLGRLEECAVLDAALQSLHDGMSVSLVLRGPPGVGKSALLDHIARSATDVACTTLAGVEAESHLAFVALHRLAVPYLDGVSALPATQREALEAALGLSEAPPASMFLVGLAMLSLLTEAARHRPLLRLVDDAQWLDPESIGALAFVARRLHAEGVGLIFAVRDPPGTPHFDGIPTLVVPGLGPDAAVELLLRVAQGHADRRVADRTARFAEGNPLVLVEVGRELAAGRMAPGWLVQAPLPVGRRLEEHFRAQMRDLPATTRGLLLLAAADSGGDPTVVWRAASLQGIAASAASAAEEQGLIELTPQPRFRHPLIRSATYYGASGAERRDAHRVLAQAVDPTADLQQHVWHMAAATMIPDAQIASDLDRSAQAARQRGGYLAEAELLARAAELSPDGATAVSRRLRAAEAALSGGAPLRAEALLAVGGEAFYGPLESSRALRVKTYALLAQGTGQGRGPATLVAAARACAAHDGTLTRELLLEAVMEVLIAGTEIAGTTPGEVGAAALDILGDPDAAQLRAPDLLLSGLATLIAHGHAEAAPRLRRALAVYLEEPVPDDGVPVWALGVQYAATAVWDDRAGVAWLERCEDVGRRTGALRLLILIAGALSMDGSERGWLGKAEQRTEEVHELGRAMGWSDELLATIELSRLWALAYRGQVDETRRQVEAQREVGKAVACGDLIARVV